MAENYIVYERNKDDEDKRMWVVKYRDPVTKKFGSEKRIDALNIKLKNEKKHFGPNDEISANLVAERAYAAGLHSIKKGQDIGKVGLAGKKFIDFLYEYWDWEHSPYNIKAYLGKDYAATCMSMIRKGIHQELDSFLRKEVAWYKGGIMLSPEERMLSGQNLKMEDLKSAGKDYAEKRAKENRRAFIAEAESFYREALSAIKDDGRQASLVKLVEQLLKDRKLTEEDCKRNTTYQEAYNVYKAFKMVLTEKAKAL